MEKRQGGGEGKKETIQEKGRRKNKLVWFRI
jgi:hypothetical protein